MATHEKERPALALITEAEPCAPTEAFERLCAEFGIELEAEEVARLGRFLALLLANNTLLNLTAIRDEASAWERHVFDALTLMSVLHELPDGAEIADLGSGGGVPALPLAIAMPQHRFTLVESTKKKCAYLLSTARALGLDNVRVISERAESLAKEKPFREAFDVVTARAVGVIELLVPLAFPLVKPGGRAIFVKGERADEELESARKVLGRFGGAHEGTVDTPTGKLVVLVKAERAAKGPARRGKQRR